jgi:hypothetical protein
MQQQFPCPHCQHVQPLPTGHLSPWTCLAILRERVENAEAKLAALQASPQLALELFWQIVVNSQVDLRERRQLLGRLGQIHGDLKLKPVRFARLGNEP